MTADAKWRRLRRQIASWRLNAHVTVANGGFGDIRFWVGKHVAYQTVLNVMAEAAKWKPPRTRARRRAKEG